MSKVIKKYKIFDNSETFTIIIFDNSDSAV